MSQFIGTRMPEGFAGTLTRGEFDYTTEAKVNGGMTAYGLPVKLDSKGKATPCTATSDVVHGFTIREVGQANLTGIALAPVISILRRGYLLVSSEGTPAIGGQVYLSASGAITAESDSTTAIPGCKFCSAKNPEGLVEIEFNI